MIVIQCIYATVILTPIAHSVNTLILLKEIKFYQKDLKEEFYVKQLLVTSNSYYISCEYLEISEFKFD